VSSFLGIKIFGTGQYCLFGQLKLFGVSLASLPYFLQLTMLIGASITQNNFFDCPIIIWFDHMA
jgi:hypothetical protein